MFPGLYTAITGMQASQVSLDNVSNNIANENTAGYKKRVVELNELGHLVGNDIGRGVSIGDVVRATNMYLYDSLMTENSKESYQKELSGLLGSVETIFQETETAGFSKSIDNYFQALTQLGINKDDPVAVNNYINQSNILVNELKNLYSSIEAKEKEMKESLEADVDKMNKILNEIAAINKEIETTGETNELLDRRDLLEKELSSYVDIEVDRRDPYIITVGDERVIWSDNVREFSTEETLIAQKDKFLNDDGTSSISVNPPMDIGDKFEFTLDGVGSVEVEFGEFVTNADGDPIDINGDGIVDDNDRINNDNYVRGLTAAINADPYMSQHVTAYNGDYTKDAEGNIIPPPLDADNFLVLEAKQPGVEGRFETTLEFQRRDAVDGLTESITFDPNEKKSFEASNEIKLFANDIEITPKDGSIVAKLENLTTNSGKNSFQSYKDMLDNFAFTLSDVHQAYAVTGDDEYTYGDQALIGTGTDIKNKIDINLFSGTSVDTLEFNKDAIEHLDQKDLDYLNTIKDKNDFTFNNGPQDPNSSNAVSFSEFYQALTVKISEDKENSDFLLESQVTITQSISNTYDQTVLVNKDEELLNLVKFQAAYEASAKVVTVVDQMLQTLLGIKQ